MDSIVEKIAREVMLKLKAEGGNRGGAYSPPVSAHAPVVAGRNRVAVLITANFKVVDQVLAQISGFVPADGKLLVSEYLYQNQLSACRSAGCEVHSAHNLPASQALKDVRELVIPSLSINTLAKAASLIADSYATQIISYALIDGIPITVSDESLLDASRYFPSGVARKVDGLRRDLESMGVRFQRGSLQLKPEHKCTTCSGPNGCVTCATGTAATAPATMARRSGAAGSCATSSCLQENCPRSYGSCSSSCEGAVKKIIDAGAARVDKGHDSPVPPRELAGFIDHTLLKATATVAEITKLCEEARQYTFASVCVNPANVALAAKLLRGCPVKVCTVVGFPLGATSTFTKVTETRDCVANGATEIDMVINVGALKSKDYELVKSDIARVVEAAGGNITKVILETSLLNEEEKIKGCELAKAAGADFVKTSTGFSTGGATVDDIKLMRRVVGPSMGVKASGGVRDTKGAQEMIAAGATRIGASASVGIVKGTAAAEGKGY